jgi:hypothetical protein
MLKRLLVGLVIGLVLGGLLAAVLIKGLAITVFGAGAGGLAMALLFAAITGVVVGLIAGKPIWASGGQIEAGLKAFFGALLAAGLMYGVRRFLTTEIDLSSLGAGSGALGALPATTLPIIAALLGGFYEVDNTPEPEKKDDKKPASKPAAKVRVGSKEEEGEEDGLEEPKKAKK